jgi:uncharacterized protein
MSRQINILAFATLFGFSLIGIAIIEIFTDESFSDVLKKGISIYLQIPLGIAYGLLCSTLAWFIISMPFFKKEKIFYSELVSSLNLSPSKILIISFCAGIGEEIFFRAAVQEFLGIWITAIVFVALHGYLNPKNWKISIYGAFMVIAMVGKGYLYEYTGLFTVITAHTVIDIELLKKLSKSHED